MKPASGLNQPRFQGLHLGVYYKQDPARPGDVRQEVTVSLNDWFSNYGNDDRFIVNNQGKLQEVGGNAPFMDVPNPCHVRVPDPEIGEMVREMREGKKISREQLAELAGKCLERYGHLIPGPILERAGKTLAQGRFIPSTRKDGLNSPAIIQDIDADR